ncbi:PREDICTED: uncharacterized protein LOC109339322 [Lupinus angustifolius]|uniref:uncharacterized protein LOC109339322 n=1 Tax=Lupinus angustifolius TaxID=3871 RepID=UPI00092F26DE|nr:PREDICTED: uncharacterized protein LOC109339322 [Lupinus angustifolius]
MVVGQALTSNGPKFSDPTLYMSLVGALQYLIITHPNLAFVVNFASQFLHYPTTEHFQAVKTSSSTLIGYSDVDWARCPKTRHSTNGYAVFLGDNLFSWSAKKQPTVSCSSCESEYQARANIAAEVQ